MLKLSQIDCFSFGEESVGEFTIASYPKLATLIWQGKILVNVVHFNTLVTVYPAKILRYAVFTAASQNVAIL